MKYILHRLFLFSCLLSSISVSAQLAPGKGLAAIKEADLKRDLYTMDVQDIVESFQLY